MPFMIFDLTNISDISCLRLNAEFLDSVIDLFADENLSHVEKSLNFIEKIQLLGEKFYTKVIYFLHSFIKIIRQDVLKNIKT